MLDYLWLVPALPFLGCVVLVLSQGRMPHRLTPWIGVGSVGIAAVLAGLIGQHFLGDHIAYYKLPLWTWLRVAEFSSGFGLYLDALSLNMMLIVTGIGFLIHLYSAGFMADDPGYARFFAYMNLFVAAMLVLVLADNLLLLYAGWEGVGLCSYLLIGFWYENPANGAAARKAFVMTRVGDMAFLLGLLLLFEVLGSLDIQTLMQRATLQWPVNTAFPMVAAALLLGGAVGKSAQLPLQTWLPDAMAGPTPVSALIHAATMVTAGVYLIARTHVLFQLAPPVREVVAYLGAAGLLMAACSALAQHDIKRILAYSTLSQLGYMFLGLGVGAYGAAVFHLTTHAYFKALLFLAAGAVIHCYHHEHDIFRMGGLRRRLPLSFGCFVIGSAALSALPYTSGYYSKHAILAAAQAAPQGLWLWGAGVLGAALTGLYSFRLIFVVFYGPETPNTRERLGFAMTAPLLILAGLAIAGGWFGLPLHTLFPKPPAAELPYTLQLITELAPWAGILMAAQFYLFREWSVDKLVSAPLGAALHRFWQSGWGFDGLYERLLVEPFRWLAEANRADVLDDFSHALAYLGREGHRLLSATQNGRLRWYAAGLASGVLFALALGILS
ncbi:NADH-quinone oxidoreductase subunit L [Methylomagnum ishizawai]|uniref:NADH-ubiquinone oxidoreductase chain 5 n=1 Tax=Methylomagnum ishizawai TaxID=1760988 RepID=A0A1Y6D4H0_9GAMM|nr:NADH-quinone oxidoreductase subunit L [Methylomagnum ishizawai]SMF94865.1 NADH-quinone oxidoreductase subunit L [Methylomagnum ishizawai]